uniref:Uncharacterized protein n=1 Tax=Oryza glumipatula TaxID=40148 RepID=A0A0E0AA11_9ORYZ
MYYYSHHRGTTLSPPAMGCGKRRGILGAIELEVYQDFSSKPSILDRGAEKPQVQSIESCAVQPKQHATSQTIH